MGPGQGGHDPGRAGHLGDDAERAGRHGVQYKYTRGSWETVEHWGEIVGTVNRSITITYGADGVQLVDDTSLDPATPDAHESVRAWIDIPPA